MGNEASATDEADEHHASSDKAVAFASDVIPPRAAASDPLPVSPSAEEDDDDDDDEEDAPAPPTRGLSSKTGTQKKSTYFHLQTGQTIETDDFQWRASRKNILSLEGDEITAPAPPLQRLLRRFGLVGESTTTPPVIAEEEEEEKEKKTNEEKNNEAGSTAPKKDAPKKKKHYRIESKASWADNTNSVIETTRAASFLSEYLRWTFHKSFFHVLMATFMQFLFLAVLFAIFVYAVDLHQPQCITGGSSRRRDNIAFGDAYHLSWTTLSTVGYGAISPSLAKVDAQNTRCLGINILMAVEAFIGVLFSGFAGAIIFGKIARVQSIANVRFSYPLVIRYGLGVVGTGDNECEKGDNEDGKDPQKPTEVKWPCPILEFRIVNELSEQVGGEIMNASVNVAASCLESIALAGDNDGDDRVGNDQNGANDKKKRSNGALSPLAMNPIKATGGAIKSTGKALFTGTRKSAAATGNLIQKLHHGLTHSLHHTSAPELKNEGDASKPFNSSQMEQQVKAQIVEDLAATVTQPQYVTVDEGNSKLAPRRVYVKLDIDTDSHPFFKRVWTIRHVLNEGSPLLSAAAKRMIANNDGFWPAELTNYKSVRQHVHFEELVVSFSGTSNVSGSSVYAQKVYDYEHLNIGYAFAPILAVHEGGRMEVDHRLLNDVREQPGGGGEPILEITESAADSAQVFAEQMAKGVVVGVNYGVDGLKEGVHYGVDGFKQGMGEINEGLKEGVDRLMSGKGS